ncbi:MAG: imidazole glycerol phosphate synthase subunit HisH [Woeseiaceae bacterium]
MGAIAIIDSGGANISSIQFALERLGKTADLTNDAAVIRSAERVLLPGVGAAKDAMSRLHDAKLVEVIRGLKQPVLGICLGMQLLLDGSEEENVDCLGIVPGTAALLPSTPGYPVPNMGWCATTKTSEHSILDDISDDSYFYYLHSYALPVSEFTLATATHASEFSAIVGRDNFLAVQFHPERSSRVGAQLLDNFLGTVA